MSSQTGLLSKAREMITGSPGGIVAQQIDCTSFILGNETFASNYTFCLEDVQLMETGDVKVVTSLHNEPIGNGFFGQFNLIIEVGDQTKRKDDIFTPGFGETREYSLTFPVTGEVKATLDVIGLQEKHVVRGSPPELFDPAKVELLDCGLRFTGETFNPGENLILTANYTNNNQVDLQVTVQWFLGQSSKPLAQKTHVIDAQGTWDFTDEITFAAFPDDVISAVRDQGQTVSRQVTVQKSSVALP